MKAAQRRAGLPRAALGALVVIAGAWAAGCGGAGTPKAFPSSAAWSGRSGQSENVGSPSSPAGALPSEVLPSRSPSSAGSSAHPSTPVPLPPPVLVSMTPGEGPPGTVVRLVGYHFGERPGRVALLSVSGGSAVPLAVRRWTPQVIEAVVPEGLGPGRYTPEIWDAQGREAGPAGSGAWPEFDLVGPPPVVSRLAPTVALAGDLVEIDGQNFGNRPGRVVFVQFWGTPAATYATAPIVSWAPDKVVVRSPGGQNGMARIRLTTADGQGVWAGTLITGAPATGAPSGAAG
ncbi:MAG: hypothetical protein K6U87_08730 [Firmicutes bacterium]|nr:hypothetical protein [Bacillota bacterium]